MSISNQNGPYKPANQPDMANGLGRAEAAYLKADDNDFDLMHYVAVCKERWRLMVVVFAVIFGLGVIYTLVQRPVYESEVTLLVATSKSNSLMALANAAPALSELQLSKLNGSVDTVAALISNRDSLENAYFSLKKNERDEGFGNTELLPNWAMNVEVKQNTDILEVKVRSYKPTIAAKLANGIVKHYLERDYNRGTNSILHARRYTHDKMLLMEKQLNQANKDLADYKKEHGLFSPDIQMVKIAEYMATLQLDLENSSTSLAGCDRELEVTQKQIAAEEPNIKNSTVIKQNPSFAACVATIDELYKIRTEQLEEYTPQSKEIKALDSRIASHQKQLKDIAETVVDAETNIRNPIRDGLITAYTSGLAKQASLHARIDALDNEIDAAKAATSEMPERQRKLTELVQRAALLERTYGLVSDKYYALLISEQGISPSAQIVSQARAEKKPIYPKLIKNVAVLLIVGIVLAVLAALGADVYDPRLRDKEKIERLTGYFAMGVVPQAPDNFSPLTGLPNTYKPMLESFRVLRNNIYFAGIESKLKVVAVTSTLPGEGKSVIAINLAKAMAMDNKRVLLVDCNMHRPSLRTMLNVQASTGLTNVLSGACDVDKAVIATNQENLFLLPTGPLMLSFVESLNSERGRKMFMQCSEKYDAVIIDCPSLANLSEIQMISTLSDYLLFVVSQQDVQETQLTAAMHSFAQICCPSLGLVINRSESAQMIDEIKRRDGGGMTSTSSVMEERV